jgi:hypothetical protein
MKTAMIDIYMLSNSQPWLHNLLMNVYHKLTFDLETRFRYWFLFYFYLYDILNKNNPIIIGNMHAITVMSKWVSDWCLTPKQLFFSYIMARTSYNHIIMMMSALYMTCTLKLDLLVLAHWNNNPQIDISLHVDTLSLIRANKSLFFFFLILCA